MKLAVASMIDQFMKDYIRQQLLNSKWIKIAARIMQQEVSLTEVKLIQTRLLSKKSAVDQIRSASAIELKREDLNLRRASHPSPSCRHLPKLYQQLGVD